jgi:hypothetical protein
MFATDLQRSHTGSPEPSWEARSSTAFRVPRPDHALTAHARTAASSSTGPRGAAARLGVVTGAHGGARSGESVLVLPRPLTPKEEPPRHARERRAPFRTGRGGNRNRNRSRRETPDPGRAPPAPYLHRVGEVELLGRAAELLPGLVLRHRAKRGGK